MKGAPLFDVAEAKSIVECARKYSGKDGVNSKALSDFVAAFKPPKRTVSAATWHALAGLKWPSTKLPPNLIISIIMALAGAPSANSVTSGEIKSMTKDLNKVDEYEKN